MEEKKLIKRFMGEVHSGRGLGVYGITDVIGYLKNGIVDTLIITDEIPYLSLEIKCNKCGNIREKILERKDLISTKQAEVSIPCSVCNSLDLDIREIDIVDLLEELSQNIGSKMEVISAQTEEGNQLISLGGIGALLRFSPR